MKIKQIATLFTITQCMIFLFQNEMRYLVDLTLLLNSSPNQVEAEVAITKSCV